jgi:hypothetical protein
MSFTTYFAAPIRVRTRFNDARTLATAAASLTACRGMIFPRNSACACITPNFHSGTMRYSRPFTRRFRARMNLSSAILNALLVIPFVGRIVEKCEGGRKANEWRRHNPIFQPHCLRHPRQQPARPHRRYRSPFTSFTRNGALHPTGRGGRAARISRFLVLVKTAVGCCF